MKGHIFRTAAWVGVVIWVDSATAAAPIAFDQWQISGGTISAQCPQGLSCAELVNQNGFLQRLITGAGGGQEYIQTIISDKNATAPAGGAGYSDEQFILRSTDPKINSIHGLASRQAINFSDTLSGETYRATNQVDSGWANTGGSGTTLGFYQNIGETVSPTAKPFTSIFDYKKQTGAFDNVVGFSQNIDQTIGLGVPTTLTIDLGDPNKGENKACSDRFCPVLNGPAQQVFIQRERQGNYVTAGSTTLPGKGKQVYWTDGDHVKVTWIGNANETGTDPRDSQKKLNGGLFGYWSYDDTNEHDSSYDTNLLIPWDVAPFGAMPKLPDVVINTPRKSDGPTTWSMTSPKIDMAALNYTPTPVSEFLTSNLNSGAPVPANQWSVNNGAITANCPAGFHCGPAMLHDGFYQRRITELATGKGYLQMILTDKQASGNVDTVAFASEDFVNISGNGEEGYAGQQRLHSPGDAETGSLDIAMVVNAGWARNNGAPSIDLRHEVHELSATKGHSYEEYFHFVADNDAEGKARLGMKTDLFQSASSSTEKLGKQLFLNRRLSGTMLPSGGSVSVPSISTPSGIDTLTWKPGEDIAATLLIQNIDGGQLMTQAVPGTFDNPQAWNDGWGGAKVSYIGYTNKVGGTLKDVSIVTPSGPILQLWAPNPFGPLPPEVTTLVTQ